MKDVVVVEHRFARLQIDLYRTRHGERIGWCGGITGQGALRRRAWDAMCARDNVERGVLVEGGIPLNPKVLHGERRALLDLTDRALDVVAVPAQREFGADGVHEDVEQF